ncbi:MAG: GGDEF domain-containing protein [Rhizobacter sp.]
MAVLAVSTVAALLWNRYGMEKVLVIGADTPFHVHAVDDRSSGGNSVGRVSRRDGKLVLDCDIRAGYEWPYCELGVDLERTPHGIDLTRYDTVRLWIGYAGPEPEQQVRFFIMNFNPAYSKLDVAESSKVHEIFYDPSRHDPLEVRLSQFTVASWWSNEHSIPIEHAGLEMNNVTAVQVATGGKVVPGAHRITVERIEFHGKWVAAGTFRLAIIGIWLMAALVVLVTDGVLTRRALLASRRGHLSLQRIHDALRLQSESFERLARRDPLTGLLNRRGLGDELLRLAKRRDGALFPLSLVFMDIDHFKQINDRHGHALGDRVLREFAQVVRADIQRQDLYARWGGEEFVLVCPLTEPHEARRIAERLRQRVAAREWADGIYVTCSFGVAESAAGEDLADAVARADAAMYRAKQLGRNRVELEMHDAHVAA